MCLLTRSKFWDVTHSLTHSLMRTPLWITNQASQLNKNSRKILQKKKEKWIEIKKNGKEQCHNPRVDKLRRIHHKEKEFFDENLGFYTRIKEKPILS